MKNQKAIIIAIVVPLVAVVLAGIIVLSIIGFNLFWSRPDLSFSYDAALANGYTGSEADFLSEQDTPSTRERQCYEDAVASGEFSGTYLEFLQQFEKSNDAVAEACSSVVCVGNTGAGVIYSLDGDGRAYIITYERGEGSSATVTFSDGTKSTAQLNAQYSNSVHDYHLAVYRVNEIPSSASVAKIADSDSVISGERVYAIGNSNTTTTSADCSLSVTAGVVSVPMEYRLPNLPEMRIDAQIDGNESVNGKVVGGKIGGGVFNARGELVGIVHASREMTSGINKTVLNGFGYAIPSNFIYSMVSKTPGIAAQVPAPETSESGIIHGVLASSVVCIKSPTSAGAGVIYSLDQSKGDAYILTNYHVVHGKFGAATSISVYLYGDYQTIPIPAKFFGGVMSYDIAVLKITNSEVLKNSEASAASIADSDSVTLGEQVYALGNPNGEGFSVTKGIVSVTEEYVTVARADEKVGADITVPAIRTDAALNHGNSGGGLFNARGELVGITNARRETSDDGETVLYGFGYAIPSNFVRAIAENVIAGNGTPLRAQIVEKVSVHDSKGVYDESACKYYIEEKLVVDILGTDAGSVAGIRRSDTLLSATVLRGGDKTVVQLTRLSKYLTLLFELREGDILTFTCSRNGNEKPILVSILLGGTDFKSIV